MDISVSDVESSLWEDGYDTEVLESGGMRETATLLVSNGDYRFMVSNIWFGEQDEIVFDSDDIHLYSLDVLNVDRFTYSHQLDSCETPEEVAQKIIENFS